jgi:hypothetical protein
MGVGERTWRRQSSALRKETRGLLYAYAMIAFTSDRSGSDFVVERTSGSRRHHTSADVEDNGFLECIDGPVRLWFATVVQTTKWDRELRGA